MRVPLLQLLSLNIFLFALILVVFMQHLDISPLTKLWKLLMKPRISSLQDVDLRVDNLGILLHMQVPIQLPDRFVKEGASLLGELAVNHYRRSLFQPFFYFLFAAEETALDLVGVGEVSCAFNVAA